MSQNRSNAPLLTRARPHNYRKAIVLQNQVRNWNHSGGQYSMSKTQAKLRLAKIEPTKLLIALRTFHRTTYGREQENTTKSTTRT
jgi:hypothetical protein